MKKLLPFFTLSDYCILLGSHAQHTGWLEYIEQMARREWMRLPLRTSTELLN